jgi:hypothetical protein
MHDGALPQFRVAVLTTHAEPAILHPYMTIIKKYDHPSPVVQMALVK